MLRNALEPWHLIILVLVVVIVFGANRLPDAARSLGRSMRIFKSEVGEMHKDGTSKASKSTVDGDVVEQQTTTTTTRTERPATGSTAAGVDDDYVVIDGVRYRRESGDTPRA